MEKELPEVPIKILIVDDYELVREGIKTMLNSPKARRKYSIDEASTGKEAFEKAKAGNYDLILLDYQLPDMNGADITEAILRHKPMSRILALSNYEEEHFIRKVLRAGAKGYILKKVGSDQLYSAIESVLNPHAFYATEMKLQGGSRPTDTMDDPSSKKKRLTKREREILQLVVLEHTNEEIAQKLFLSPKTVDSHRHNIHIKLGSHNSVGLLVKAIALGLIDPNDLPR